MLFLQTMKRRVYIAVLLAAFLGCGSFCNAQSKEETQGALISAVERFVESDYAAAKTILDSLSRTGVEDDAVEYYLGLCEVCNRRYDLAEKHFRKACEMDPSNYWYRDWLANVLVGTNQVEQAIEAFESMLRDYPKKNELYLSLVNLYAKKGDYEKVLSTLDTIDSIFGKSDQVASARMDMLVQLRRYDDVIKVLEETVTDPSSEKEEILAALETELAVYYNKGDMGAMARTAQRMIQAAPGDAEVALRSYSTIGDALHSMGDSKNAFKCYKKALKIDPEYTSVLNNYAYYLSEQKRQLGKAYKMSKITIEKEPDNATYLDTFAWILHLQGKDVEAKPFFKHAMLYGGKESATVLSHFATVLRALGENDLATYYEGLAAKKAENK